MRDAFVGWIVAAFVWVSPVEEADAPAGLHPVEAATLIATEVAATEQARRCIASATTTDLVVQAVAEVGLPREDSEGGAHGYVRSHPCEALHEVLDLAKRSRHSDVANLSAEAVVEAAAEADPRAAWLAAGELTTVYAYAKEEARVPDFESEEARLDGHIEELERLH